MGVRFTATAIDYRFGLRAWDRGFHFSDFAVYVCLHQLLARLHQLLALHAGSRSCDWCYFGAIDLRSS